MSSNKKLIAAVLAVVIVGGHLFETGSMDRALALCQQKVQADPSFITEQLHVSTRLFGARCTLDDGTVVVRTWWFG